ncbi:MAG: M6 family metalloprotease domain-containing protein [Candidatus Eisenbacteria bacterium]|nr:M6 family metalloprotease domain-containing protein [Candidatus Eisenbacteria bacterium]
MTESYSSSNRLTCACLLGLVLLAHFLFVPESAASSSRASGPQIAVPTPAFVPGYPFKKGPVNVPERHRFEPRSLLREHGLEGANLFSVNAIPASPDTITKKVLAILVDFSDQPFIHERLFVERHLFFFKQYYSIVSGGRLQLEPVASDSVFTMPSPMTEYGADDDLGLRLVQLAQDAVEAADSLIDFTLYDEVMIIHAGLAQEADILGDSPELIWSASLGPAEFEYYLPDSLGRVGIATNDTLPDGRHKYIQNIAVLPEDESQDGYMFSPLGVYVHEFGHCLGLPDLYDTGPSGSSASQGIGNWGVMGTGLWNANGYSPAEPCAWSKAILGWRPVRIVSRCDTCELSYSEGANQSGELVLVPIGGREYFLIENRLQDPNGNGTFDFDDTDHDMVFDTYEDSYSGAEFDYFLPGLGTGSGLLIWHVDEQQIEAGMPYNTVNADRFHKGVSLEEADGVEDLSQPLYSAESYGSAFDSFREGNNTSFTPSSLPNSDGNYGGKSWVFIEDIGAAGQSMSFSVEIGKRQSNWPVSTLAAFGANHPNAADLDGDGSPELVACDEDGNLYVLRGDGTTYLGSGSGPLKTLGERVLSSPVLGDIDGDGLNEIVVVAASGTVFAWNGEDGSEVRDGDDNPATDGVLAQVTPVGRTDAILSRWNDEGRDALIFGGCFADTAFEPPLADSLYPLHVVLAKPDSVETFTWLFPGPTFRAPVACDLDGDGTEEILVTTGSGDGRGRLNLIDDPGVVSSDPQLCDCELGGDSVEFVEIVAGDLDLDTTMDIAGADTRGRLHLMHVSVPSGEWTELAGWPVDLVARDSLDLVGEDTSRAASISIGEIDNDGRLEVLATFGSRAYAVNYNGTVLTGWPPLLPVREIGEGKPHGPLCADVTQDHRADYVGALSDGRLACVQADATIPAGWPLMAGSSFGASPLLADVDGDGLVELVCVRDLGVETFASGQEGGALSYQVASAASIRADATGSDQVNGTLSGQIDVWELGVPFEQALAFWPSYRRDGAHSGVVPNSLSLPPAAARTVSKLFAAPNPARGASVTLHYTLSEAVDRLRVGIYDLAGRCVYSASPGAFAASDNWHTVQIGGFPPGVYLCCVEATKRNGANERVFAKLAVLR